MTRRDALIEGFLTRSGWTDAARAPLAADLSARSYSRLRKADGTTAILMDAPPGQNASTPAFVAMTSWLRTARLNAPEIYADDIDNGLLLLEDFGGLQLADVARDSPEKRHAIYRDLLEVLILIRAQRPPDLPCPDAERLTDMTSLADTWYPGADTVGLTRFRSTLKPLLSRVLTTPATLSLRDFHANNVMWLPDRPGLQKFGLLDYQDAFLTHPSYDLVSLLTDARTDISPDFRNQMIAEYQALTDDNADDLALAFATLSAQRNIRILGVFARAAKVNGKAAHLEKLPRVYGYFAEALEHPAFSGIRDDTLAALPEPTTAMMDSLR